MNKVFEFLEQHLMGPLSTVANTRVIRALMNAGLATVPFTIVSSIFLILNNLPAIIPPLAGFFKATILKYSALYSVGNTMALGSIALFYVLAFGYYLTATHQEKSPRLDNFTGAILSLYAFLMTVIQVRFDGTGSTVLVQTPTANNAQVFNGIGLSSWVTRFGGVGIFIGIVTTLIAVYLYKFCIEHNITIRMPSGVPAGVERAFASLLPAIFISFVMIVINGLLAGFGTDVHEALSRPFGFVKGMVGSWGGMLVILLLVHLLWAVGVHGTSIVKNAFVNPVLLVALTENMNGGQNIFAGDYTNMYVFLGGAGSTLALVILMLFFAKSTQLKTLSRASILPGVFNINEPIIFGAPIVYNPYLVIPFIVTPLVTASLTYFAISVGLIGKVVAAIPWVSPVGVGAFLGTAGDFRAVLLALINLAISAVFYYPFFRMYDKKLVEEESVAGATRAD